MINADVKSIDWCDEYSQNVGEPAMLALTASIGEKGKEGLEYFQVVACNPEWIAEKIKAQSGLWPRGMLIVDLIDPDHIKATLQNLVDQFQGAKSWAIFTERLNRYLLWEYEDYNDYQGSPKVPIRIGS